MGKCSGLKGGGHHRKAVDVAAGKKKLKENQRKEQIESNKRSVILKEILTASTTAIATATATAAMDADIYLQVEDDCVKDHPLLCRSYFRYDNCCNRRCQFSHHYSITDALSNIVIGTNTNTSIRNATTTDAAAAAKDDNDDDHNNNDTNEDYCKDNDTIPALQLIPGILHNLDDEEQERKNNRNRQQRMMMRRRRRRNNLIVPYDCADADADADADAFHVPSGGIFEMFAFEGYHASIMNTIVSYIECDLDVIHFSESCQYMNYVIGNCQDVQVRQYQQKQRKLQHRNDLLLFEKSVSGRLRYAVMYVSDNHINHSHSNNECDNNINTSINIINNDNDNDNNNKNDRHNSNNTTTANTNTNTSTTSKSKSTIRKEKRDEKKRIKNMKMNNSNNNSNNENGGIHNNKKTNVGDSGGSDRNRNTSRRNSSFTRQRRRPILIYDHENPNVYAAYQHTIEQQQRQRSQ